MIKPSDIVKHLKTYLPRVTDLFSTKLVIVSATISGGLTLSVNSVGHALTTGQNVVIGGGTVRNKITSATLNPDDTVRFTTEFEHDLTEPSQVLDDKYLTFAGFGSVWDGQHLIDAVPNRKNLDVALPAGETVAPTITGDQYLLENRSAGLSGVWAVDSVIDTDNFTILLSDVPDLPNGTVDNLDIISGYRIAAAESITRAQDIYTNHQIDELYLFVIMSDLDISRDRHTDNDSVATLTRQNLLKLTGLQNFSTTVFAPTDDDLSGADAHDLAYGEIYTSLLRVLHGCVFSSADNARDYITITTGHGGGVYNTAYLVHVYDWQSPFDMTSEIGFNENVTVAFRDIDQTANLFGDSEAAMTTAINLDDEPL